MSTESSAPQSDTDEPNTVLTPVRAWVSAHPVAATIVAVLIVTLIGIEATRLYWWVDPDTGSERNDFLRTAAALLGAAFVVTSLYFTRETLKTNQRSVAINQETVRINAQNTQLLAENQHQVQLNQLAERFFNASQQLESESLHTRLGALYMLESIANESDRDYSPVFSLIVAYIRERTPRDDEPVQYEAEAERAEPEYVAIDVQVAVDIIGRRRLDHHQSTEVSFDLRELKLDGAVFTNGNFARASFAASRLRECVFKGGEFSGVNFDWSDLREARFLETRLVDATFSHSDLSDARFVYRQTDDQPVPLMGVNFGSATLSEAVFYTRDLSGIANIRKSQLATAHLVKGVTLPDQNRFWNGRRLTENSSQLRFDLTLD